MARKPEPSGDMSAGKFIDEWAPVRRACRDWHVDAFRVVGTAKVTGVSPDEVLARFDLSYRLWVDSAAASVRVDNPVAVWPGHFDARLLFQGTLWFDDVRTTYAISQIDDEMLVDVIHRLMVTSEALYAEYLRTGVTVPTHLWTRTAPEWIESTPLMQALRVRALASGLAPAEACVP